MKTLHSDSSSIQLEHTPPIEEIVLEGVNTVLSGKRLTTKWPLSKIICREREGIWPGPNWVMKKMRWLASAISEQDKLDYARSFISTYVSDTYREKAAEGDYSARETAHLITPFLPPSTYEPLINFLKTRKLLGEAEVKEVIIELGLNYTNPLFEANLANQEEYDALLKLLDSIIHALQTRPDEYKCPHKVDHWVCATIYDELFGRGYYSSELLKRFILNIKIVGSDGQKYYLPSVVLFSDNSESSLYAFAYMRLLIQMLKKLVGLRVYKALLLNETALIGGFEEDGGLSFSFVGVPSAVYLHEVLDSWISVNKLA